MERSCLPLEPGGAISSPKGEVMPSHPEIRLPARKGRIMLGKVTSTFCDCFGLGRSDPKSWRVSPASPADVVSGMKPKEAPLAGYLLARAATHKKVEGQVLQDLRAGHESMQQ